MSQISLTNNELKRLYEWVNSLSKNPISIRIQQGDSNGIGKTITAWTDYGDDTGEWKCLTDYLEW